MLHPSDMIFSLKAGIWLILLQTYFSISNIFCVFTISAEPLQAAAFIPPVRSELINPDPSQLIKISDQITTEQKNAHVMNKNEVALNNLSKILYFSEHIGAQIVVLDGGHNRGFQHGTMLKVYRPTREMFGSVQTGLIKIIEVNETQSLAKIVQNSTARSESIFSDYPDIMAGDLVEVMHINIRKKIHGLPKWSRTYHELFKIPGPGPATFELSETGKEILTRELSVFREKNISKLFIKAYTDETGSASENQIESYQRALTIQQFMKDTLGFRSESLESFGMGETDLKDESNTWGATEINRRIEIFAVPGDY